jgi:hypothetical protein
MKVSKAGDYIQNSLYCRYQMQPIFELISNIISLLRFMMLLT